MQNALALTVFGSLSLVVTACGGRGGQAQGPASAGPGPTVFFITAASRFRKTTRAFVDVTVLPMSAVGEVFAAHTVVVRDGIIEQVGPAAQVAVPADAEIIGGAGRFLMPGLADMHVHTTNANDLYLYLANGITTVRMMWGTEAALDHATAVEAAAVRLHNTSRRRGTDIRLHGPGCRVPGRV